MESSGLTSPAIIELPCRRQPCIVMAATSMLMRMGSVPTDIFVTHAVHANGSPSR